MQKSLTLDFTFNYAFHGQDFVIPASTKMISVSAHFYTIFWALFFIHQ